MDDLEAGSSHAWRSAITRAMWVGGACASACFAFGKPSEDAVIDGLIVTFGGLIAWATYHLISRRADCLMLVALNILPIWRRPVDPWLPPLVITGLAMLGVGLVMGLVNRPMVEREPDRDFAWWDAEVDGPR